MAKHHIIKDFNTLQKYYRNDILELTEKYGVTNVRVFGSVARGDVTEDSDIDLLVTLNKPIGFAFAGLENKLSEILFSKVQLVSDNGLSSHIGSHILNEARPL